MDKITIRMKRDKVTKGTYRFVGEIGERKISIYLPKDNVPSDVEDVIVSIK